MNKNILWLIGLLFVTSLFAASCSETDGEVDPYANWEERNQRYIDSIATVAAANLGDEVGKWKVIRSYKLPDLGLNETGKVNDYVYCKILEKGTGTVSPIFTDSVDTHYKGEMIPLLNGNRVTFDQSYSGSELNVETDLTVGFKSGEVITGWTSALQAMKAGDRWQLYIPHELAYGETGSNRGAVAIPGYSALIFDLMLVKVIPLKGTGRSVEETE